LSASNAAGLDERLLCGITLGLDVVFAPLEKGLAVSTSSALSNHVAGGMMRLG